LLLIDVDKTNITCRVLGHIAPCRADRELTKELDKLHDIVEKLQRASEANPHLRLSYTEAILMQCTHEVIEKCTTMYEASLAAESVVGGQGAASSSIRVAEWVSILESIRQDQRPSDLSDMVSNAPFIFSGDETHTIETSATSAQRAVQEREAVDAEGDDAGDDLDTDLAKAALDTGSKAFEAQDWEEADSLLQEGLRVLRQLPTQQRAFCDIFSLHYKLAVCAYHTQEPADAEEALMSLVQQSAISDEERGYIYDAGHLLSQLYICIGQVDRARSECEKALQARRRLLGKQSDASLESTALMSHIYVLLNNRARAKSYLAMIPEARRDSALKAVEESLGTKVEHLDSSSPLTRAISEDSDLAVKRIQSRFSASSLTQPMENHCYSPATAMISQSPAASHQQSQQRIPSNKERRESRATETKGANLDYSTDPKAPTSPVLSPGEPLVANETFEGKTLSRKDILEKIGCQPRDRIEAAVCDGDHSVFASLLDRKKGFWQSKLRKRIRPERVTALHFAALFGEIDMARRLISSNFNINEVPHGYTSSLTPLTFAIGARQVDMVEFLIANGAKPSGSESWSTLAGQLMNRSWLMKTMSEGEKDSVPSRIIVILSILLKHGWDMNAPFETSGRTVLHQAVTFWTGSYVWDLNLRAAITSFLCERGADPFQANTEGKTAYDMALASGHKDLLLVLDRGSKRKELDNRPAEPVELSS